MRIYVAIMVLRYCAVSVRDMGVRVAAVYLGHMAGRHPELAAACPASLAALDAARQLVEGGAAGDHPKLDELFRLLVTLDAVEPVRPPVH
jgi:hypothetical protein